MKLMISLKAHRYGGKMLQRGDLFRVRGVSDERLLVALGRAERHEETPPAVLAPMVLEAVAATVVESSLVDEPALEDVAEESAPFEEAEPEVEISARTGKPKRQYTRRNMTAED